MHLPRLLPVFLLFLCCLQTVKLLNKEEHIAGQFNMCNKLLKKRCLTILNALIIHARFKVHFNLDAIHYTELISTRLALLIYTKDYDHALSRLLGCRRKLSRDR